MNNKKIMCLAIPGEIISISGDHAEVDFDGLEKNVNISLLKEISLGDWVIVHAGFAIEKMSKAGAKNVKRFYEKKR